LVDFARKLTSHAAWLAAVLTAAGASAQAEAEPEVVTASLELVSMPGCGSESDLGRAIQARSERIRFEEPASASRRLRIELRESGSGVTAVLSLTQPSGRRSSRTLRASGCAEALESAALVAAVSLDPMASTAPAAEVAPVPAAVASPRPLACPRCPPVPAPPSTTYPRVEWSALVAFDTIWGPAPRAMLGFGGSLLVAYERESVLSPALRLTFSHFARSGFEATGGSAEFSLDTGSVELCPLRARAGALRLYPCLLRVAGGRLQASGSHTVAAESRGRPWWELGASLLAQVKPARSFELGLSLAAGWPVVRDRFQFEPVEFHQVSGVVWTLGAGAGVTFP
jgi:hypothetical protein